MNLRRIDEIKGRVALLPHGKYHVSRQNNIPPGWEPVLIDGEKVFIGRTEPLKILIAQEQRPEPVEPKKHTTVKEAKAAGVKKADR